MNDTPIEIRKKVREMMMLRTGEERFVMGALMFDAARKMIIASLPQDLSADEFKRRLFKRVYGVTIESVVNGSLDQ